MTWLGDLRSSLRRDNDEGAADITIETVRHELAARGISSVGPEDLAEIAGLNETGDVEFLRMLQREFSGLGDLVEPLQDPAVTDVVVNPDGTVWVDRGAGMSRAAIGPFTPEHTRDLAVQMAAKCGSRLDSAMPFADGVLTHLPQDIPAQALRIHCLLSPPAQHGPCISVRVLSSGLGRLPELQATGMLPGAVPTLLREFVEQRKNVLITGGTGSGKTSLLTALMAEIPHTHRVVLLEDTPEIIAQHPHVLSLTARRANAEGTGEISMQQLVKQSLRMRPDRIVVGEIRGPEIADLLVALNTGHAGSAGTVHANSPQAVPGRLEALGAMAGMSPRSLVRQALDGIDVLVHLARTPRGRRVTHISRLVERGGALDTETIWGQQ